MPTNALLSAALLLTLSAGADAAAPPPPPPKSACQMALDFSCGAALSSCSSYPCAACEACVLGNQTALIKAGCTSAAEIGYCSAPAPLVCIHTDSRGDTYDLSGIPKVDGEYKTVDHRNAYYHVGICGSPTSDPTDPTKGCLPACDPPCTSDPCACKKGIDIGGEAVCQYDPDDATHEYNSGMLDSKDQVWADGSEAGMGVTLKYTAGSTRGGCSPIKRSTDIIVHCDPCNQANISFVDEPSKCHYRVNITSIAGCEPSARPAAFASLARYFPFCASTRATI